MKSCAILVYHLFQQAKNAKNNVVDRTAKITGFYSN